MFPASGAKVFCIRDGRSGLISGSANHDSFSTRRSRGCWALRLELCCRGKRCPAIYIWIALVVGGLGMWRMAREWLTPTQAVTAAVLYAVNPYSLIIVYYRSDFAELLASAILPFSDLASIAFNARWMERRAALAAAFALVWLTNAPGAVIATYSLALILVVCAVFERDCRPLVAGGVARAVGSGWLHFTFCPRRLNNGGCKSHRRSWRSSNPKTTFYSRIPPIPSFYCSIGRFPRSPWRNSYRGDRSDVRGAPRKAARAGWWTILALGRRAPS